MQKSLRTSSIVTCGENLIKRYAMVAGVFRTGSLLKKLRLSLRETPSPDGISDGVIDPLLKTDS